MGQDDILHSLSLSQLNVILIEIRTENKIGRSAPDIRWFQE